MALCAGLTELYVNYSIKDITSYQFAVHIQDTETLV